MTGKECAKSAFNRTNVFTIKLVVYIYIYSIHTTLGSVYREAAQRRVLPSDRAGPRSSGQIEERADQTGESRSSTDVVSHR